MATDSMVCTASLGARCWAGRAESSLFEVEQEVVSRRFKSNIVNLHPQVF